MANGKKKIIIYADWMDSFNELTDEEAGKLIKHLFAYVNDKNPILNDRLLKMVWIPMQQTLKRDLKKWEQYIEKQTVNGAKGGRPKKTQKTQAFFQKPKKADSVSVIDSDNVIELNTYQYLIKNFTSRLEQFEMKNKKNIDNYDKFIDIYNTKVILEGIPYEQNKLFARLEQLKINWKKEKSSAKKESLASKMKQQYGIQ